MAYSGWLLPTIERGKLLSRILPVYPDIIAHHMTLELGDFNKLAMPPHVETKVVGVAADDGVQALVIEVNGSTIRWTDGSTFHITWSLDRAAGKKPVDSNTLLASGWNSVGAIQIRMEPHIFK